MSAVSLRVLDIISISDKIVDISWGAQDRMLVLANDALQVINKQK